MASNSNIPQIAFFALIGAAIFFAGREVYRTISGIGGAVVEGATWLIDETGDYINGEVEKIKQGAEIIGQGAEVVGEILYDEAEKEVDKAIQGLEIIKEGSKQAYDYLKSLW
jgi:hypothetical protein